MKKEQIAVGNYTYPYHSFDYFLDSMQRLNVSRIELWAAEPHFYFEDCNLYECRQNGKKIRERGIEVCCVTPEQCQYPINIGARNVDARRRSVNFFRRAIDVAVELDAPKVLVTSGHHNYDDSAEDCWKWCVESLQELASYARLYGKYFVFEPLVREIDVVTRASQSKKLLDEVGQYDVLKAMIDVDEAARFGETPKDFLKEFGIEKFGHVHFMDGYPGGHLAPGDGKLPLNDYLDELDSAGYEGDIALEIMNSRYDAEPEKAIKQALDFFDRHMSRQ